MLAGITLWVERDENRRHVDRSGSEHFEREPHRLQVSRTDVGAAGVAEINQHELSAKIRIAANFSVMIRQTERAPDGFSVPHDRIHQFCGRSLCNERTLRERQHRTK